MPRTAPLSTLVLAPVLAAALALCATAAPATDWPRWRGPEATGVAPAGSPPLTWSETENVLWKVPIPGRGHATPVVAGERVFVSTAIPTGDAAPEPEPEEEPEGRRRRGPRGVEPVELRLVVLALDRTTGETLWERTAWTGTPHEGTHPHGTWASASAVTDGEHVVASFGSMGLHAYTVDGKPAWSKDLGDMRTRLGFGEGSSPALHDGVLVVNWDHEGDSFVVALDKATGEELWRRERDEPTSWATPLVIEAGEEGAKRTQVVVSATNRVRSYDLATGELLWEVGGMTVNTIPSPVAGHGMLYATSGFRGNALRAVKLAEAKGDVTGGEAVAWSHDQDTPYVPSPLLYGDLLYILKHNRGILTALDAETGEPAYGPVRLPEVANVYASPVGAAGRVYVAGREGATVVLDHGREHEVLAVNRLDDGFDASPAVSGDILLLRGREHLYALRESGEEAARGREGR